VLYPSLSLLLLFQFGSFLLDIPFILLALTLLVVPWRFIHMLLNINHANATAASRRRLVLTELFAGILDLSLFFPFVFILVTFYRLPRLYRRLSTAQIGFFSPYTDQSCCSTYESHGIVWEEFGNILIDIPHVMYVFSLFFLVFPPPFSCPFWFFVSHPLSLFFFV
jgi:hypothetical protein